VTKLEFGEGGSQATIVKPAPASPPPKQAAKPSGRTVQPANRNRNRKRKRK